MTERTIRITHWPPVLLLDIARFAFEGGDKCKHCRVAFANAKHGLCNKCAESKFCARGCQRVASMKGAACADCSKRCARFGCGNPVSRGCLRCKQCISRKRSVRAVAVGRDSKNTNPISIPLLLEPEPLGADGAEHPKYDLVAVVQHYGGLHGGHYTATVLKEGSWVLCDDEKVAIMSTEKIEAEMRAGVLDSNFTPKAMVYVKRVAGHAAMVAEQTAAQTAPATAGTVSSSTGCAPPTGGPTSGGGARGGRGGGSVESGGRGVTSFDPAEEARRVMRPLTREEAARVRGALATADPTTQFSSIDGNYFTAREAAELKPGVWLKDETINVFLMALRALGEAALAAGPAADHRRVYTCNTYFWSKLQG